MAKGWIENNGFSVLVTRYPTIDLRQILDFLATRWAAAPLQTLEGDISPFWQHPDVTISWGVKRQSHHFLSTLLKQKHVWGPNRPLFHYFSPKKGRGVESKLFRVYLR
jgi:hypothetical protein